MKKMCRVLNLVLCMCLWVAIHLVFADDVNALYNFGSDTTRDKVVAANVETCFSALKSRLTLEDIHMDHVDATKINALFLNLNMRVPLINTMMNGIATASPSLTCREFLFGNNGDWSGVVSVPTTDATNPNLDRLADFLTKMGYTQVGAGVTNGGQQRCITVSMSNAQAYVDASGNPITFTSNQACFTTNMSGDDEYVDPMSFGISGTAGNSGIKISKSPDGMSMILEYYSNGNPVNNFGNDGNGRVTIPITCGAGYESCTWGTILGKVDTATSAYVEKVKEGNPSTSLTIKSNVTTTDASDGALTLATAFEKNSAATMRQNLTGVSSTGLTTPEVFNTYTKYISNGEFVRFECGESSAHTEANGYYNVRIKRDGNMDRSCYVREKMAQKYTGAQGSTGRYKFNVENLSLKEIVDRINAMDIANYIDEIEDVTPNATVEPETGASNTQTSTSKDGETVCKSSAGVLGWILCPIIKAISGIGEHMWTQIEENHLKIQAQEMFVNNTGVKDAFDIVRNISNVVFIILFMIVIFSQLTGVGIDNYGIKRILPRLILVAILANLSYYMCEIAIDISNIFGNGINNVLTDAANNIGYGRDGIGAMVGGLTIDAILGTGAVAIFLTLNPAGAVMGAIGIAFAVFGIVVAIVAALLVLYLIVVIREAAIIILVVVAPIAIVCYALPNTEKIYKRWFDIFKALLIVYPICGAMVGAGRLAAAVLGQINTQSMAIAAMIVQVIPFFLIPMLLKNSLSALGNIGAKISNAGRNLSRRASGAVTNGIRGSEKFKDFSKFQQEQTAAKRAQRIKNKLDKVPTSQLTQRQAARLAAANTTLREAEKRRLQNQVGSVQSVHEAELAKQAMDVRQSAADTMLYSDDAFVEAQEQKAANSRRDRWAEAEVGVLELDRDLALNRAQSRRDTQEYKAYQDQFAGYDRGRLTQEARTAGTWMNQAGGAQRMSALLQALEANGLENEMFSMLDKNDVSKMRGAATVMQTLSSSKNKVAKAYGKKAIDTETGRTVSYREFMTGTGSQSMRAYMDGKGASFADGLDDKALFQIRNMGTSMRTGELIDFASKLTDNDSIKEVNEMISSKIANGETFQMNGKQLAHMHDSTMIRMLAGENGRKALLAASDDLDKSPELINSVDATVKIRMNALRTANNKPPIGTPSQQQKQQRQGETFENGGGI